MNQSGFFLATFNIFLSVAAFKMPRTNQQWADVRVNIQTENAPPRPCFFFLRAAKYGEVTKYVVGGQENLCKGSYLKTISEGRLCSPKRMDVWEFS